MVPLSTLVHMYQFQNAWLPFGSDQLMQACSRSDAFYFLNRWSKHRERHQLFNLSFGYGIG